MKHIRFFSMALSAAYSNEERRKALEDAINDGWEIKATMPYTESIINQSYCLIILEKDEKTT